MEQPHYRKRMTRQIADDLSEWPGKLEYGRTWEEKPWRSLDEV